MAVGGERMSAEAIESMAIGFVILHLLTAAAIFALITRIERLERR